MSGMLVGRDHLKLFEHMLYIVYFPSDSFANAARSSLDFTERYPLYASLATN